MKKEQSLKSLTILLRASGSVINMLKKDMRSYGLNPTEFTALEVLYNLGEQPIQTIGEKVLLASSSITYVIKQLEKKELVIRTQDKNDRRVSLVSLSKQGYKLMEDIFPQHSVVIEELFDNLTIEELYALEKSLKEIGYKAVELYEEEQ